MYAEGIANWIGAKVAALRYTKPGCIFGPI
jgi:hypothetical protein